MSELNGKAPPVCLDELYGAIYVAARQFIINGFPREQAFMVMEKKHAMILDQLNTELRHYEVIPE